MVLRGEDIAHAVRPITDAPNWQSALVAFASIGPPTGDTADNRRLVEEQAEFVFSAMFPRNRYGGDGLLRFTATTDEDRSEYRLSEQETFSLQMRGPLVAEGLLRFLSHHELPSTGALAAHFGRSSVIAPPLVALAIARSFHRWWAGDYEGAAFTVVPQIETLARNLLLAVDAGIYRLQRESRPGQYPGLGSLLGTLQEHGLNENWYRYLYTTLASPTGWNLRNEMVHGFVDDVGFAVSALALQCAAYLTGLGLSSSPPTNKSDTGDGPTTGQ